MPSGGRNGQQSANNGQDQPRDSEKEAQMIALLNQTAERHQAQMRNQHRQTGPPVNVQNPQYDMTPSRQRLTNTSSALQLLQSPDHDPTLLTQQQQTYSHPPRYMLSSSSAQGSVTTAYDITNRMSNMSVSHSQSRRGPLASLSLNAVLNAARGSQNPPSQELINLLSSGPDGIPSADDALDIKNFPFVEVAVGNWSEKKRGVLKLRVSHHIHTHVNIS